MFRILLACMHFFSVYIGTQHPVNTHHFQHASTITPTIAVTLDPSTTPFPTEEITLTPTADPTLTPIPSETLTPEPTLIATPSPTLDPTLTPTVSPSADPTLTPIPTVSPTTVPTLTPIPSPTLTTIPTATKTPTPTMTLTLTPTASATPIPTNDPTPTASATPTLDPTPTVTLTPTPTITKIGNDISYPQCGKQLPVGQGFGIVGVNGGIASTSNPCLSTQLLWAGQSLGTINQQKVQLYVNTGNPGGLGTATWPTNNTDPAGNVSNNPYGTCDGSNSTSCAWQYGWNRAVDDVQNRFIPAAQAVGVDSLPADYLWWLDVETTNSWDPASQERNRVDLEAMVSYFQSRGITVGIYSTSYQFGQIVGVVPATSNLNGLGSWLPGASDLAGAQSRCGLNPLTSGGRVIMTQFSTIDFDYDYSCL